MPSIARLQQTNPAADSTTETPLKTHRDFFRRRKGRQISSRESSRECGSTESPYPRFLPRACFLADLRSQSSANKGTAADDLRKKKFPCPRQKKETVAFLEQKPPGVFPPGASLCGLAVLVGGIVIPAAV